HREAALDVVHSQGEEGALFALASSPRRVRRVLTPRYPSFPDGLRPGAGLLERARLWVFDPKYPLLGRAIVSADQVCVTSRSSAAQLSQAYGLDGARLVVIPNGVDAQFLLRSWQGPSADAPLVF